MPGLQNSGAGCVTDFTDSQGRKDSAAVGGFPDSGLMVPSALRDGFSNTASQTFEDRFMCCRKDFTKFIYLKTSFIRMKTF